MPARIDDGFLPNFCTFTDDNRDAVYRSSAKRTHDHQNRGTKKTFMINKEKMTAVHREMFGEESLVVRAPGRINLIGEHTDYNNGFVLPAAVDKYVCVSISLREDRQIALYSVNYDEKAASDLDNLSPIAQLWANYVLGVAYELSPKLAKGFNMCIAGDIPLGAGMSSSAALESAVGFALSERYGLEVDRMELALIGQRCEHRFIGVKCGIMDQFASLFGKDGHVVRLDCRDLSYAYFPLELGEYELLLLNTNVKHSLASSAYNDRRAQCERAVERLRARYPEVESLRDASVAMLDEVLPGQAPEAYARARFVVEEIARVVDSCEKLQRGDLIGLGRNMYETHAGLSRDYGVSCPELDFLVDYVRPLPEVIGARMMGGGFGGCTINLVHRSSTEKLAADVSIRYRERFGIEPEHYRVQPGNGTVRL